MTGRRALWLVVLGVGALAVVLFWPCVRNGFTHWDDDLYLQQANAHRLTWAGIQWAFTSTYIYYHPLTWLSHGLDCVLWGLHPAGHHATSVAIHAGNAMLVVLVVWSLTWWLGAWTELERLLLAAWVGAVFAVHPLQVEPVAWLAGRKTLLAAGFCFLAVLAYSRWARATDRRGWWWAAVAAYVAALLSKPTAVPLVAVFLLLDWFPLGRRSTRSWRALFVEKWLMFACGVTAVGIGLVGQTGTGALQTVLLTPSERLWVAARSMVFYLWKLSWPAWLSPFYPLGGRIDLHQPEFLVPVIGVVALTGIAFALRSRLPHVLVAWGAYGLLVLPASGLIQAGGQAVADRFAYLPIVAMIMLGGGGLVWLRRHLVSWQRALLLALVGGHLTWLSARTQEQIPVWQDDVTLWQAVLAHYPNSSSEHRFVAQGLMAQGRVEEAIPYAERAYEQLAGDPESWALLGVVFRDIAVALVEHREFGKCIPVAQRATELLPDDAIARAALGLAYLKTSRYLDAAGQLEQAVALSTDLPAARYNLACAYAKSERLPEALSSLRQAVADRPQLANLALHDPLLAALRESLAYSNELAVILAPR